MVLVDLGSPTGGLTQLTVFYSNLLIRLAVNHLLRRKSPWGGHHVRLVIDEAQIPAEALADCAEMLLTTGRSRGISLCLLSQGTVLLDKQLLGVIMTNTPSKLIGRLSAPDAEQLAREQTPEYGIDETVATVRQKFVTAVTNLPDREFFFLTPGERQRFTSMHVDLDGWQQSAEEHSEELEAMKRRLAIPADTPPRVTLADATGGLRPQRRSKAKSGGKLGGRFGEKSGRSATGSKSTSTSKKGKTQTTPWG